MGKIAGSHQRNAGIQASAKVIRPLSWNADGRTASGDACVECVLMQTREGTGAI